MDSITQAALGIAIAHIGFKNAVSKTKLILFGAIVATLPDLDIYIAKFYNDPLTEIEIHRGFSHSILFYLLLSVLITFVAKRILFEIEIKKIYLTTFLILLTHSLLDIFTTWGTQILWWYPTKFALKSIFVVDLFYTLPLIIGLVFGIYKHIKFTYLGLIISSLYLVWGLYAQSLIKHQTKYYFIKNIDKNIKNITVKPTFSNSILWNVIIETDEGFYLTDKTIFEDTFPKFNYFPHNNHLIKNLLEYNNIKRLIDISENQYVITKTNTHLLFNDLRFGLLKNTPNDVQFAFSYQLNVDNNSVLVKEVPKENRDGKKLLLNIWNRIFK